MPIGFWLVVFATVAFAVWMLAPIVAANQRAEEDYKRRRDAWCAESARALANGEPPPPPINTLWFR